LVTIEAIATEAGSRVKNLKKYSTTIEVELVDDD
jgi:hypothetical protein